MNPARFIFQRMGAIAMEASAIAAEEGGLQRIGAAFRTSAPRTYCARPAAEQTRQSRTRVTQVSRAMIPAPLNPSLGQGLAFAGAAVLTGTLLGKLMQSPPHKMIEAPPRKIETADIANWENKRDQNRPLIIVAGINGVGRDLVKDAIEKGHDVLGFSRQPDADPKEHLCIASTPRGENLHDTDKWIELLEPIFLKEKGDTIHYVNMIGDTGERLSKCAFAMASAMSQLAEKHGKKVKFVQLSSIAASYLTDQPYAIHRNDIDQALVSEYPHLTTLALRPSLIIENGLEDHSQPYGPWQMASGSIPFAISSDLKLQPLATSDLNDAIINAKELENSKIVNAVGPDPLTQKEIVQIFVKAQGRDRVVIEVPIGEVAQWIGINAPLGRFHDYAIKLALKYEGDGDAAILPTNEFEELVGHELTSIKTLHNDEAERVNPPIIEHIGKILKVIANNPEKREEFFKALFKDIPLIAGSLKTQILGNTNNHSK